MGIERPIAVTFFASSGAKHKREEVIALPDLAPRILSVTKNKKAFLPWLKLARFGDQRTDKDSLRNNGNVLAISGIEADYDHGITPVDQAVEVLRAANLAGLVYTSPSHNEDAPRWRVLCPLSQDYPPEARVGFLERLNGLYHGSLSGESFTLSQSYYFGSIAKNPSHAVEWVDGDFLDLRADLDEGAIGKPKTEYTPSTTPTPTSDKRSTKPYIDAVVRNALAKVAASGQGQKHHTLRNQARLIGGFQAEGGFSTSEALDWLMAALPSDARDRKAAAVTAAWGLEQGARKPLSVPEPRYKPNGTHAPDIGPKDLTDDAAPSPVVAGNVVRLQRPERVPNWRDEWHRTDSGAPLPSLFNALVAMRAHPPLASIVRYDDMQLTTILSAAIPDTRTDPTIPRPLRDKDVIALQETMQRLGLRRLAKMTVQDAVDLIASENAFHPVREYLDGLTWDGTTRVRGWLGRYLGVEGDKYPDEIGQLFLVALVARIYKPGCQADYVLVLEGPQGAMKSSACRALAGKWFSDSLPDLTHADPVRLSMHLRGKWLIEIAELASFNASETEIIKAFATRTHETYTPKYGRNEVTEPRQCILIASTNQPSYLHDETGARRFWPVRVGNIKIDDLRADRDQLFAEAVHLFRAGARWWPSRDFEASHIAPEQAARYEEDAWEGAIEKWLAHNLGDTFTITEIAKGAISMELERLGTREQRRIRKVLIQLGWSQGAGRAFGRKWKRPEIAQRDTQQDGD